LILRQKKNIKKPKWWKNKETARCKRFLYSLPLAQQTFSAAFRTSPFVRPIDLRIITALEQGMSPKQIASAGRMSVTTVRHRITRINEMHSVFVMATKQSLATDF